MESFLSMSGTLLGLLLITNSKAYDNLLENSKMLVITELGRPVYGAENIIDGNPSTCLDTERFYRSILCFDFTIVQSFYEVAVSLDFLDSWYPDDMYIIRLSIYVSNSTSVKDRSLCGSEYVDVAHRRSYVVKRKCMDQGRFIVLKIWLDGGREYRLFICDISITGCENGRFGENCTGNCSENCLGKSCDILDGKCSSGICSDGWQGEDCNQKCPNGTYGYQCNSSCGNCKDIVNCNHETGYCNGGCAEGSMGLKCDKECPYGFYGKECSDRCNMTCGYKSEQQKETNTRKLTSADFNKTTVYAMGSALTLSLLVNILFAAMCIIRFRVTKKNDIYDKPSSMYVNVRADHKQDRQNNKPSEGMELDQQKVQYEAVRIPCNENHYEDLE
ncbi:cell death abnormality protein 1-like isoform X3 [Saccostrea cucullata]|uniref:cell death abnormality protein 1-like isoform X3 n=1 Tax=Saccostrea cuccullata TaxID=36930 RepID=UPI002ED4DAB8